MDPVDFFLSLPNTLEGEAETLYRMRMEELLWRAGRYGEDPTEAFLERLQRQFPGHTAERIREFQEFSRGRAESLLTYYNRLINVAEDVRCTDNSLLISKFLGGLDEALGGGLRMRVYELGAEASLEEVFDLAERVELAQRKYEAYLPRPTERSRRPTWAAAIIPEGGGRTDARGESGIDTRTCHRCGQPGHLRRDCKNCDGCGKPGHRKRECPDAARCEICKKRGHEAKDCYQREGGIRRHPEELQRQISRLQAQLRATGLRGEAEAGMYARDEEGEEVEQDVQCALMAWRGREEMGLRSGGKDGKRELGKKEQVKGEKPTEPALERAPARHPQERLACQTSVLLLEKGAMEVEGEKVKTAIIDTGAQSVMLGKGMAERLGLLAPERHVKKGMLVMTAEGGEPKWMPCTRTPIEVTLLPGGGGARDQNPHEVRNLRPKRAYQAVEGPPPVEQGGPPGLGGAPRMKRMDKPQQQSDWQQPIHLVELFGGIGAGLSTVVRNGIAVRRWTYVEKEPVVRRMAEHHARKLQAEYPELLSERVIREAMGGMTHDVKEISEAEVVSWGHVDLLVAGWECQGVSWAGKGKGEGDQRTRLMEELFRILEWLQERQGRVAYLLENLDLEGDSREPIRLVRDRIRGQLGEGVSCDAARMGSRHEQCNQVGQERRALPTLVAYVGAAGYKWEAGKPGPGMVYDHGRRRWEEPTALEWELAMGYREDATAAPGASEADRRRALGNAMDGHVLRWLVQRMWCKVKEMELKLSSTEPVFHRRRKMPPGDEEICKEKIKELLEAGLIRRSESEYATPTVVAARRDLTEEVLSRRMCGDYRALNKITVADRYPMPMAEEIFDKLVEGVFFTTLDLRQGLNQIKIREEDIKKTAFHGPDGLYEWLYMPFGLRNASAVFQRVMDSVLRGVECAACYIDDMVIFSTTEQQHLQDVERTLTAIEAAGLTCHPKKCRWGEQTVQYLGYEDLMAAVKTTTVLKLPTADLPFTLYTDWSSQGMGGILCQEVEGEEKVVAYASRSCNSAEAQYSSYIGEGLAAVWAVGHFRVYLQGREFTLVTDHQPLTWLMTTPGLTGRNAWWAMKLQEQAELSGAKGEKGPADIWEDEPAMRWVKGETGEDEELTARVRARGQHYRWYQQQLQVQTEDGWKLVPAPSEREAVIKEIHTKLGHFGHERTVQLLKTGWWWEGMRRQVKGWVEGCEVCQRSRANLTQAKAELQSRSIRGLGFRWSLDLAGELPLSWGGKQYIVLMVEHVSKWLEVRAIPSKSSRHVATAFKEQVTLKRGLRAYGEKRKRDWDEELHWIAAGYRFGKQAALRDHSPYSLLYGCEPLLPVGAARVLTDTVTAGTIENWVALSKARARYLRVMMPAALENLHTAQLRDARRYEQRQQQGAGGRPRKGVSQGQEVYLKRAKQDTLDVGVSTERWRVKEVRPSGVLVLENDKGALLKEHQSNMAMVRGGKPQEKGPVTQAQAARARA
ncbi:unnamed protein product [Closterium sp. NIES-54]